MTRYALYNGDLGKLLEDGTPRPKLRLILRARAKSKYADPFITGFVTRYRQFGEDMYMSEAQITCLEQQVDKRNKRNKQNG